MSAPLCHPSVAGTEHIDTLSAVYIQQCVLMVVYFCTQLIVQELCESRGGRPGLSVLTRLPVSVDVKNY